MLRGFLSTWAALIVNGVVGILLTPVMVHGLGPFYYALWILVDSVLAYSGLLDMGVRYSLQRFVARYGGVNERQALNETFVTGMSMGACMTGAVFVLCAVLLLVLPSFFHLSGQSRMLFRILLTIQTVTLALNLPLRIMGAYLCGLHRFDLYNASAIVQGALRGVVFWAVIHWGGRVVAVAVSQLIMVAFIFVLEASFVRYADPDLSVSWRHTNWVRTKELIHFSVFVFISDIGDRLRFYTGNIVISRVLTVALATPFNVVGKLMETFKMVFYPITGPLTTEANNLEAQLRFDAVRTLFLRSTKACALLAFAGTSVLILHGRDILRFWMGADFASNYNLLLVLTIGYCVILMQSPTSVFLYVRNRQKTLSVWALAEGLSNLGLSIYWARQYGLVGIALGTAVPMLVVRLGIQPFYTIKVLGVTWGEYLTKSFLRPALATAAVLALASLSGLLHPAANRRVFVGMMLGLAFLFSALSYWIVFDGSDRQSLRDRGAHLVERVRGYHA